MLGPPLVRKSGRTKWGSWKDLKDICGRGWKIQLRKGKLYAGGQCSTRKKVMFLSGSGLTIRLTIRVFIGLIKLQDQKQSGGGNRLFYLTLPGHSPSSTGKIRAETQAGKEPGGRNCSTSHGGMLLTGLPSLHPYTSRDHQPRESNGTTYLRVAPPTMGWASNINH